MLNNKELKLDVTSSPLIFLFKLVSIKLKSNDVFNLVFDILKSFSIPILYIFDNILSPLIFLSISKV